MQISGTHGLTVASVGQVTGRFNAHLRNCVFLFSDEVNWNGSKASEGALKALITSRSYSMRESTRTPGTLRTSST